MERDERSLGRLESATAIADAVRRRAVSATEVVERALARIETRDGPVNACVRVLDEEARDAARALDAGPRPRGVLAGVPVTVKEIFAMRGERTTWGVPALRDAAPSPFDDPHVAALRAAGAVIVARTNVPELSCWGHTDNPVYGETRNPRDTSRTPGGSSGGAAASVALGIAPLALGTDAGGSVRIPASFCGIVGFKPSFTTLPADAVAAISRLNCAGVLSGNVADVRLAMAALTGREPRDSRRELRLAATPDHGFAPVDPEVRTAFDAAVEAVAAAGMDVVDAAPPARSPLPFIVPIIECEVYDAFAELLERPDRGGLSPETVAVAAIGRETTGREYMRAVGQRLAFEREWEAFFTRADILLSPTTQVPAFPLGSYGPSAINGTPVDPTEDGGWYPTSFIANVIGSPAISLPCGVTADGLPVGLQVLGRPGEDAAVLAAAAAVEVALAR